MSADFPHSTADDLRQRYPDLTIEPVVGGLLNTVRLSDHLADVPKVGFFPGSTLGNLTPEDAQTLLMQARDWPSVDAFILGVNLVKVVDILIAAYDDATGSTAKFISNILVRLNHELGANFDLGRFKYQAVWNADLARIEMSLISACSQVVTLADQEIEFAKDEAISVSMSRKYTVGSIREIAAASGWIMDDLITDKHGLFAVAGMRAK